MEVSKWSFDAEKVVNNDDSGMGMVWVTSGQLEIFLAWLGLAWFGLVWLVLKAEAESKELCREACRTTYKYKSTTRKTTRRTTSQELSFCLLL
jgi:hypothetical protein